VHKGKPYLTGSGEKGYRAAIIDVARVRQKVRNPPVVDNHVKREPLESADWDLVAVDRDTGDGQRHLHLQ
jgi:hypothetical protein